ncbi:MAG: secondary thiamine-phosphate synthase enzyme YjbQ [Calditrichota bacterium]
MMVKLDVKTNSQTQFIDITQEIQQAVGKSGIKSGTCHIFIPHTTAGVTINENADPSVTRDILMELNKVIPFDDSYHHMEGNSAAHIKSSLVGCSIYVIIDSGQIQLGTWQGIYFCEFDGPRSRRVWVKVISG